MAAPSLRGKNSNTASNTAITLTLPVGTAAGDAVYMAGGWRFNAAATPAVSTSGYTSVATLAATMKIQVSRKIQGGTPDANVTGNASGNAGIVNAWGFHSYSGVDQTTPEDAAATTGSGSGAPDPPSFTTVTNDAMVLAIALQEYNTAASAAPSGYGDLQSSGQTVSIAACIMLASLAKATAGAENPGTFTAHAANPFAAVTIGIRPAAGGGGGPASFLPPSMLKNFHHMLVR